MDILVLFIKKINFKNLIICGRSSNRLKTNQKPKSLIQVGNKMIINRVLENFNLKEIKKIFIIGF